MTIPVFWKHLVWATLFDKHQHYPRLIAEERSQARARLIILSIFLLYIFMIPWLSEGTIVVSMEVFIISMFVFFYALAILLLIREHSSFSVLRQHVSMVIDLSSVAYAMFTLDDWGSLLYPLFLWVIVGNGMRFGLRYLWTALFIGGCSFMFVLLSSEYWMLNQLSGFGLFLGIMVLPLFFTTLLQRLHIANTQLEIELERVSYMANHDVLTGLPNRCYFNRYLEKQITEAEEKQLVFSVLFMDLNKFKWVNDTYGHDVGDQLLVEVSNRMKTLVSTRDFAARLAGDEFAFISASAKNNLEARELQEKLHASFKDPYRFGEHKLNIGASIGMAVYPKHGKGASALLKYADQLMYEEKRH